MGLALTERDRRAPSLMLDDADAGPGVYVRFSWAFSAAAPAAGPRHVADDLPLLSASQMQKLRTKGKVTSAPSGLLRLTHGWYATRRLSDAELIRALMWVLPDDTVVAGETAALMYGVDQRPASSYREPFRLCVARPAGQRALRRPGIRCRVLDFEPGDVISMHRVRCTSPLRTAIDLASSATIDVATHLLEVFLERGFFSRRQLEERIETMRGRRGIRTLRRAAELADPRSESVFETAVRIRLHEAGLPPFRPQTPVHVPGKPNPYRLDLGYQCATSAGGMPLRLGIECDSDRYHPLTGPKADADRLRREAIGKCGWTVLPIRYRELRGEQYTFETRVARALGRKLLGPGRRPWVLSRWVRLRNAWTRWDTAPGRSSSPMRGR